jgi:hypothetical protein
MSTTYLPHIELCNLITQPGASQPSFVVKYNPNNRLFALIMGEFMKHYEYLTPAQARALRDALAAKLAEIASDAELPPVREDKSLHA